MNLGSIEGIYIASDKDAPMKSIENAHITMGQGVDGDRYAEGRGAWQSECMIPGERREIARHVTLISQEAIDAANHQLSSFKDEIDDPYVDFTPEYTRRNILTSGVELNELVGQVIKIGEAALHVIELCVPCDRPRMVAVRNGLVRPANSGRQYDSRAGFKELFEHRGGLRAEALGSGMVRVGDAISIEE